MNTQVIKPDLAPLWARKLAAGLVGWLVFLLSWFLFVIGISSLASYFGKVVHVGSALFFLEISISLLASGILSYVLAKNIFNWLSNRKPITVFIILAVLIISVLISFPAPFMITAM